MLKGPHSSVSSASDLQSRGPGFDPQSGRGIVTSENIMSNTYVKHMSNTYVKHMVKNIYLKHV